MVILIIFIGFIASNTLQRVKELQRVKIVLILNHLSERCLVNHETTRLQFILIFNYYLAVYLHFSQAWGQKYHQSASFSSNTL